MARLQPFRDETLKQPEQFRIRLNEVVKRVNDASLRVRTLRIPNVQAGVTVTLSNPGFNVGAVVLGGVNATAGAAAPTAAPWVKEWVQQGGGEITCTIGGLAAFPAIYAVNLVLFEAEGAVT